MTAFNPGGVAKHTDPIFVPIILFFLLLKLTGVEPVTSWSWLVVLAPILVGAVVNVSVAGIRLWLGKRAEARSK